MAPSSRRLVTTMTTTATPPHRFFQAPLASSLSSQYSFVPSNRHHRDSNVLVIRQHHLHDAANLTSTLPHRRFFVTTQNDDGGDAKPLTIQLYQYAICPFCNRVKALLDYAGVDYQTVEVNPLTKAEIKPWKTEHTKVPIAIIQTDDKTVAAKPFFGSDVIVQGLLEYPFIQSCLWERWQGSTMTLEDFQHGPAVAHWTDFAANDLATLLYPNMCRTWGDSYRAFDYVHKNTSTFGPLQRVMIQSVGSLVRAVQ